MISLAAIKYRNVLAEFGGPIAGIELGSFPVRGRTLTLANASLNPGLIESRRSAAIFSTTADGTGVHELPTVARHIAVSEALERWAYSSLVRSEMAPEYGFDVDPSTCGMSAFPGLLPRQARRRSVLEAIERFSLIAWWEGLIPGRRFDTDWPGVSAVAINGPFGGITVIAYARTGFGHYVYGHAADVSFTGAAERAIVELARHEWVLQSWWLARTAGQSKQPAHLLERRLLHFASKDGFEQFSRRIDSPVSGEMPKPEILCDCEIPGPWSDYATIWRFALRPPSDRYLHERDDYFFI